MSSGSEIEHSARSNRELHRDSSARTMRWRSAATMALVVLTGFALAGAGLSGAATGAVVTAEEAQQDGPIGGENNGSDVDTTLRGEAANDSAGFAVAGVGDVDGDGVDDLAVAAPENDRGGTNAGAVYLFYGPVDGGEIALATADAILVGDAAGDEAGTAVASGDLDGEGDADVVVGAPGSEGAGTNPGAAYVFTDAPTGVVNLSAANATLTGANSGDQAGRSVAVVDGSNGEAGRVLVGAPRHGDGGAAYLYSGAALSGTASLGDADTALLGADAGDRAGWAVAAADLTGDGRDDVVVGAPGSDAAGTDAGAVHVVPNATAGTHSLAEAGVRYAGAGEGARAGWAVDAGDVTGDGAVDLLVGAPGNATNGTGAGAVHAVTGGDRLSNASLADANATVVGESAGDLAGWSVSPVGPANASCDGAGTLVGAPGSDRAGEDAGTAYALSLNASGRSERALSEADAVFVGDAPGDRVGWTVADVGDLDGNATVDVAVGAPSDDAAARDAGAVYLLHDVCPAGASGQAPNATSDGTEQDNATAAGDGSPAGNETTTDTETAGNETTTDTETAGNATAEEEDASANESADAAADLESLQVTTDCEHASVTNPNDVPIVATLELGSGASHRGTIGPGESFSRQAPPGTYTATAEYQGETVPINGENSLTVTVEPC